MIGTGGVAKGVTPAAANLVEQTGTAQTQNVGAGPSFAQTLGSVEQAKAATLHQQPVAKTIPQAGLNSQVQSSPVKFSNHAIERMTSRGISFTKQDMERLSDAVSRAQAKGSKDSLILMNDSALIVSVKNKTVVTVMDKQALKENVFTNIDSTIVM